MAIRSGDEQVVVSLGVETDAEGPGGDRAALSTSPSPLSRFSRPARPDDITAHRTSRYREWLNWALLVGVRVVLSSADGRRVDAFHGPDGPDTC